MMVKMGSEPILSIKRSVSIDKMIKFDGDIDGDGTCKQALMQKAPCTDAHFENKTQSFSFLGINTFLLCFNYGCSFFSRTKEQPFLVTTDVCVLYF